MFQNIGSILNRLLNNRSKQVVVFKTEFLSSTVVKVLFYIMQDFLKAVTTTNLEAFGTLLQDAP